MSRFLPPITDGLELAILPYTASLLDYSGNGRHPTQVGSKIQWIKSGGVWRLHGGVSGWLEVANDAALQAMTDQSIFVGGDLGRFSTTEYILSKHNAGGSQIRLYGDATGVGRLRLYDGVGTQNADFDLANRRSVCVTLVSGEKANAWADGVFQDEFGAASTIVGGTQETTLFNRYTGNSPMVSWGVSVLLWYDRTLDAYENSKLHAWSESLHSPSLPHNRTYFDLGSLVSNGPQTQYGPTGDDLIVDGDMSNPAAWTLQAGSSITGGKMVIDGTQGGAQNNLQAAGIVPGALYRVRFTVSDYVAGALTPYVGGAGQGTAVTASGDVDQTIVATTDGNFYLVYDATFEGKIDDVIVEQTNNLLSDGDMESDGVGEWTVGGGASLSKVGGAYEGDRALQVEHSGSASSAAQQFMLEVGKKYRVTGVARGDGAGYPRLNDSGIAWLWTGSTSSVWQAFDETFIAQGTNLRLYIVGVVTDTVDWDSMKVREVFETVGAWDLGASTGRTEPDKSGNGNDADLIGPVMSVNTELGRALLFDGASGTAKVLDDSNLNFGTGDFSIECVVKATQAGAIIEKRNSGGFGTVPGWGLRTGEAIIDDGAGNFAVGVIASPLDDDLWHHVAVTFDRSGNKVVYIDGEQDSAESITVVGDIDNARDLYIGSREGTSLRLGGAGVFAKVHNRVLSLPEIKAGAQVIARKLLYRLDLAQVPPGFTNSTTGQVIPWTDYTVSLGAFAVQEVASEGYRKGIVCVTAGQIWRPDPWAFGTRLLEVLKQAGSVNRLFVSQSEVSISSGSAYYWFLGSDEAVALSELGVGNVFTTPAGTMTAGAAQRFRLTRARNGDFVGYLNDTQIGTGNDLTVTTSTFSVLDFDAGDILFEDEQYLGVLTP